MDFLKLVQWNLWNKLSVFLKIIYCCSILLTFSHLYFMNKYLKVRLSYKKLFSVKIKLGIEWRISKCCVDRPRWEHNSSPPSIIKL